ncbi:hypothetical protein BDR22DRAFT_567670 [Usnea florida]
MNNGSSNCMPLTDILRLSMFGKSWQKVQSEAGFSASQFAACRPRPGSIDFSHLLVAYYCSCKPSAPPSFRCHSSPLITPIRLGRFKNDRFYLDNHLVPRRTSSSLHLPTRRWVCFPTFKVWQSLRWSMQCSPTAPTLLRTDEIFAGLITLDLIDVTFWRIDICQACT